jgi:hypothetical protein
VLRSLLGPVALPAQQWIGESSRGESGISNRAAPVAAADGLRSITLGGRTVAAAAAASTAMTEVAALAAAAATMRSRRAAAS